VHLGDLEMLWKVLLGTLLGSVIGFERDLRGRSAGLRTHAIVAMASATFMVVSTRFIFFQHYGKDDLVSFDPSRIASTVVSGIGFLGAGAIMRTGLNIRGLTTAAALWLVAAIGMTAGAGMYAVAVFVTALGLFTLTLLRRLEDRGDPIARQRVTITAADNPAAAAVAEALTRSGAVVSQQEYERRIPDGEVRIAFELRTTKPLPGHQLATIIEGVAGIKQVKIEAV
jgi:putative Mg2+ transporter-C (MgtC) family protein